MLPWSSEFSWDAGHLAFFGAFYSVLLTIAVVLGLSLRRAVKDARSGRADAIAWHAAFQDLPPRDRACRHQITGEAPGRACDNAFDCRSCAAHPSFLARRDAAPPSPTAGLVGLQMPLDRLYHRGHSYARPEADGAVTVGLDDLARRLAGVPDAVERPAPGTRLVLNGPAFRLRTRGRDVRVLSPVDGVVVGSEGTGAGVVLRVDPGAPLDTRALLSGDEVRPWALRELERFEGLLGPRELGVAMADGGELLDDLGAAVPPARLDAVLGEMFLDL
jgi:hypothetical protein